MAGGLLVSQRLAQASIPLDLVPHTSCSFFSQGLLGTDVFPPFHIPGWPGTRQGKERKVGEDLDPAYSPTAVSSEPTLLASICHGLSLFPSPRLLISDDQPGQVSTPVSASSSHPPFSSRPGRSLQVSTFPNLMEIVDSCPL